ncbi:hypothetical protein EYF80_049201 [Liparis tanakae]|uniref:Uncharacterized protein n=1 Tax=Liparis tanakae TaxID=230148 RepID=A0A4Z2FHE2_9TELE|nr:hypothetical protein EYF80_049201 [Liparis tanakae]
MTQAALCDVQSVHFSPFFLRGVRRRPCAVSERLEAFVLSRPERRGTALQQQGQTQRWRRVAWNKQ